MPTVAIVGAGDLGGSIAHKLAQRDRVDQIRLIDPADGVAAGKALDIQQAGPIEGFRTNISSSGDLRAALGARVVVVADPIGSSTAAWDDPAAAILEPVARLDRNCVFVCAGPGHRPLIERGVDEAGISAARLVGSAPAALASAIRAIVALEVNSSPSEVSLAVLGTPPDQVVIPWSEATVQGQALVRTLEPPRLARLIARVRHLWPPGPYTLASAASRVCEAIATGGSSRGLSCLVDVSPMLGRLHPVTSMTVRLGSAGVERIVPPSLSPQERVQFDDALAVPRWGQTA